ncbi:hypothetical protein SAY86_017867 [Trapa natans]|uniref:Uncharacterized protein n=1 Tax=Trapa natans TaxID=22666 RepID=A0AAN7R988_TRANT|nr:hypothetical protein SAY86_017867 [Trapa natans]
MNPTPKLKCLVHISTVFSGAIFRPSVYDPILAPYHLTCILLSSTHLNLPPSYAILHKMVALSQILLTSAADLESEESGGKGSGSGKMIVSNDTKRVLVGAGARILFYPTLLYNVFRNKMEADFRWWDEIDQHLLLGAVPFSRGVPQAEAAWSQPGHHPQ